MFVCLFAVIFVDVLFLFVCCWVFSRVFAYMCVCVVVVLVFWFLFVFIIKKKVFRLLLFFVCFGVCMWGVGGGGSLGGGGSVFCCVCSFFFFFYILYTY